MAPRFTYFRKLSQSALQRIELLNSVRRAENERVINHNKINFKSFSINNNLKSDSIDVKIDVIAKKI